MSSFEIGILLVIGYLVLYGLVNRICETVEHCATARAFSQSNINVKPEDFENHVKTGFQSKNS